MNNAITLSEARQALSAAEEAAHTAGLRALRFAPPSRFGSDMDDQRSALAKGRYLDALKAKRATDRAALAAAIAVRVAWLATR